MHGGDNVERFLGGSGNDFARALGLPTVAASLAAWQRFCSGGGNVRDVDLGVIRSDSALSEGGHAPQVETRNPKLETFFCCIAGLGVDADANRRANAAMDAFLDQHLR